jgi:CubicO group peptidase (beta-lactamase class C family)
MNKFLNSILFIIVCQNFTGQIKLDSLKLEIEKRVEQFPKGFCISIAILKDDQIHYFGFRKDSIVKEYELKDSLFEIASVTKVFTSTLLAKQVLDKKIKLNSNINSVFPFKFHDKIKLSYISLANHTAGLYRLPSNIFAQIIQTPKTPYQNYNFEKLDEYLQSELKLETEESKYSYSNLGPGILAYTLAKKEKTTFEKLLSEDIFTKYHMESTSFDAQKAIQGINADGTVAEHWYFNALSGAGGLISNTLDLSNFIQAQFNEQNLELALTRKSTHSISDDMNIGLAWHIINPKKENPIYWHNGGSGGFTSSIAFRTSNKTGVVVLSNISANSKLSPMIDEICFEILNTLK